MTLNDLIVIMSNRLVTLNEIKKQSIVTGDLSQVVIVENDILTTETTLNTLKTISQTE